MDNKTIKQFIDETASSSPTPGGGSVSALVAALGCALCSMVANVTINKKGYEDHHQAMKEIALRLQEKNELLLSAINEDIEAFNHLMKAYRMPKNDETEITIRKQAIQNATKLAMEAPLHLARITSSLFADIRYCAVHGNVMATSDAVIAAILARSAILGSICNVKINLTTLEDTNLVALVSEEIRKIGDEAIMQEKEIARLANFLEL